MVQFHLYYIEKGSDLFASWRGCGLKTHHKRCVVASNKYLINCLVLVQSDFGINEVMYACEVWGWGEAFAIEWGCLVMLGSLMLRLDMNILGKGVSYISCVHVCDGVRARNV